MKTVPTALQNNISNKNSSKIIVYKYIKTRRFSTPSIHIFLEILQASSIRSARVGAAACEVDCPEVKDIHP